MKTKLKFNSGGEKKEIDEEKEEGEEVENRLRLISENNEEGNSSSEDNDEDYLSPEVVSNCLLTSTPAPTLDTPSPRLPPLHDDMSPITRSTHRMPKAMQVSHPPSLSTLHLVEVLCRLCTQLFLSCMLVYS